MRDDQLMNVFGAVIEGLSDTVHAAITANPPPLNTAAACEALVLIAWHGDLPMPWLERGTGLSQPAVVRLTDRLAAAGLVTRQARGRRVVLRATSAGRRSAKQLQKRRLEVMANALTVLGDRDRVVLLDLLAKVAARLPHGWGDYLRICRLCSPEVCADTGDCPVWIGQAADDTARQS
jgi:DNA-binding MarR family transcriptional regulator